MHAPRKESLVDDDVFTVADFLSTQECDDLVAFSEGIGYEPATVDTFGGPQLLPDWRNNKRVTHDDVDRAAWLLELARPFVAESLGEWRLVGINERLRFYRYDPGQRFDWHSDGCFVRENGERSFLTFMIYLNQGCRGGETSFRDDDADVSFTEFTVTPTTGMALFFKHELLHKGEPVTEGRKYVLRTDVMYAK